jgi:hypothetical protein
VPDTGRAGASPRNGGGGRGWAVLTMRVIRGCAVLMLGVAVVAGPPAAALLWLAGHSLQWPTAGQARAWLADPLTPHTVLVGVAAAAGLLWHWSPGWSWSTPRGGSGPPCGWCGACRCPPRRRPPPGRWPAWPCSASPPPPSPPQPRGMCRRRRPRRRCTVRATAWPPTPPRCRSWWPAVSICQTAAGCPGRPRTRSRPPPPWCGCAAAAATVPHPAADTMARTS